VGIVPHKQQRRRTTRWKNIPAEIREDFGDSWFVQKLNEEEIL